MAFSADATMAITVIYAKYIAVLNGSFEDPVTAAPGQSSNPWTDGNWAYLGAPWIGQNQYGRAYRPNFAGVPALAGGGVQMANMNDPAFNVITQDLGSQTFNAGDTLSVTFYVCSGSLGGGVLQASFLIGANTYSQSFDTTTQTANTWQSYTLTRTIPAGVTANLSLRFSNVSGRAGWLDLISDVTLTPAGMTKK